KMSHALRPRPHVNPNNVTLVFYDFIFPHFGARYATNTLKTLYFCKHSCALGHSLAFSASAYPALTGPTMQVKLTPGFVARPPLPEPPKDRVIHWDIGQPGFGLMVTTSGHKSYVVQYRIHHGSRRMHLKNGLTLQAARKEAKKYQGDVANAPHP